MKYWMTFNEINVLSGWCQTGIHNNSPQNLYQAHHHIFVASAKAVQIGHKVVPHNQIGMMVSYTPGYPMTCRPEDVMETITFNRQKHFYMDVQVRGYYPEYQLKVFERDGIHILMEKEEPDTIQNGTEDFIGFSYYMSMVSSTDTNGEKTEGNQFITYKNPYLKTSDWGVNSRPFETSHRPESDLQSLPETGLYCSEWIRRGRCHRTGRYNPDDYRIE